MVIDDFFEKLMKQNSDEELYDFCRKYVLHGTPHVFINKENEYYEFRKKIATKFNISFHEVYIAGSAKLGFSPFKKKLFDYNSDIDVAIISSELFDKYMGDIAGYQENYNKAKYVVREKELNAYHKFLECIVIGWLRPDMLPISFQIKAIQDSWFEYFRSISHGKSEVGNYKVSAGVFKSYDHFEKYIISGFKSLKKSVNVRN